MTSRRILVVDDDTSMLHAVRRVLDDTHKVSAYNSALQALDQASSLRPDLAIIDVRMPEMDGFTLMGRLHELESRPQIILMTGSIYDLDAQLIRAIREKAFYFIQKPFDRGVLRTLVDRCLELRSLEQQNARYMQHLESQLREARTFQQSMLPAPLAQVEGFDIAAAYHPCDELGGDLFDYASAGPGRVTLLIADVCGHGASAAMLTGIVKAAFGTCRDSEFAPGAVVRQVAAGVAACEPHLFVTLLCVRISASGSLEYVCAGHEGGVLLSGEQSHSLETTGPLVSPIFRDADWQQQTLPWRRGDRVLLYTDGITETVGESDWFGRDRLHGVAQARAGEQGRAFVDSILQHVDQFAGGRPADDDRTLLTATMV